MQQNNPPYQAFQSIYTVSELQYFYKEIDQILTTLFKENADLEHTMDSILGVEKKEAILSFLNNSHIDLNSPVQIQEALLELKKEGNTIPVVHLTLAFEPTHSALKNINLWFLRRLQKKVLLNVTFERSILGGIFISYDGIYKDYTLKSKVDKYFAKDFEAKVENTPINSA